MAGYIEGVERQQATLFPERLDELVPADALVRVLDGFVAQLDVEAAGFIRARPAGIGRPGYRPGDLLRLFLWGYLNGVRSSRALEQACWRDLEAAWLLRRLQPDFKTIADFRKNNGAAITWTCWSFVDFALTRGLIGARQVATDGSRFAAASSRKRRQAREEVEAEIAAHEVAIEGYLKDLEAADALVDPAEQAAERKRVEQALAELEAEAARKRDALAATAAKKLVVAEPEAVIFGQSDGRQPSYNVQLTPRGDAGSPRPRMAMSRRRSSSTASRSATPPTAASWRRQPGVWRTFWGSGHQRASRRRRARPLRRPRQQRRPRRPMPRPQPPSRP